MKTLISMSATLPPPPAEKVPKLVRQGIDALLRSGSTVKTNEGQTSNYAGYGDPSVVRKMTRLAETLGAVDGYKFEKLEAADFMPPVIGGEDSGLTTLIRGWAFQVVHDEQPVLSFQATAFGSSATKTVGYLASVTL